MRGFGLRLLLLLSTALVASPAAVAHADAASVTAMPTILVGVTADRAGWQRELDARIDTAIRRAGRSVRAPGPLTVAESSCRDASCLAHIAESCDATMVIGAKLTADRGSPPTYTIVLTRYDRDHAGAVRQEEAECSVCTQAETIERVEQMVSAMLPTLEIPKPVVMETPAIVAAPAPRKGPSRATRLGLIGVSVVAGVAGIALIGAGARALVIDGQATTSPIGGATQAAEVYDTRATGIGLLTSGVLHIVGASIALGFEVHALK